MRNQKRDSRNSDCPLMMWKHQGAQNGIETAQRLKIAVCVMPITPLSRMCYYYNVNRAESQPCPRKVCRLYEFFKNAVNAACFFGAFAVS